MKVICDTSVLISLDVLEKLYVLREIFSAVLIPEEVFNELETERRRFKLEDWIIIKKITNIGLCNSLYLVLDLGESEAITLAIEEKADIILLDDKEARKTAKNLGIKVIGTAGLLLLAKQRGLIGSVMEEICKLEERINFRISENLKQSLMEKSGEEQPII